MIPAIANFVNFHIPYFINILSYFYDISKYYMKNIFKKYRYFTFLVYIHDVNHISI